MIELRTALSTYLKTLHPRVYFQGAPENAVFPYIVYDIPQSVSDGENYEVINLDIDGWDSNSTGDTVVLETLMSNISAIDKHTLITDNIAVTFYLETKLTLEDDDKRIKRRKYTYQGKLFKRS